MNLSLDQYEKLSPRCELEVDGKKLVFSTPSSFTLWRVESLFTKEPWTIDWLNELTREDCLLDVGANVGMYSVWASAVRGCQVVALEPESMNYSILNKNIMLNNLQNLVQAYGIGLSDVSEFCVLNMQDLRVGGSNHAAGEALNFSLQPMEARFKQGCVVFTLDELIGKKKIPVPSRIKIDVDGFEHKVIAGAKETLKDPKVNSLLIEINTNLAEHKEMIRYLGDLGFKFSEDQVNTAKRKAGTFKGLAEYVFRR
jgi:FkbM family methyltransferase